MYSIEQNHCKCFVIKMDGYPGSAELSRIDNEFVKSYLQTDVVGTWYYFNRLVVYPKIRNKGMAALLMKQVVSWADREKVNIFNEVNPYGDLDMDQLIKFYSRFGFEQCNDILIRRI
jgi:GNAT superfamily N-acetyltransferase